MREQLTDSNPSRVTLEKTAKKTTTNVNYVRSVRNQTSQNFMRACPFGMKASSKHLRAHKTIEINTYSNTTKH